MFGDACFVIQKAIIILTSAMIIVQVVNGMNGMNCSQCVHCPLCFFAKKSINNIRDRSTCKIILYNWWFCSQTIDCNQYSYIQPMIENNNAIVVRYSHLSIFVILFEKSNPLTLYDHKHLYLRGKEKIKQWCDYRVITTSNDPVNGWKRFTIQWILLIIDNITSNLLVKAIMFIT